MDMDGKRSFETIVAKMETELNNRLNLTGTSSASTATTEAWGVEIQGQPAKTSDNVLARVFPVLGGVCQNIVRCFGAAFSKHLTMFWDVLLPNI